MMKLSDLKQLIDETIKNNPDSANYRVEVPVTVTGVTLYGGQTALGVKGGYCGFDWNHGRFFLFTDKMPQITYKKYKEEEPKKKNNK